MLSQARCMKNVQSAVSRGEAPSCASALATIDTLCEPHAGTSHRTESQCHLRLSSRYPRPAAMVRRLRSTARSSPER